MGASKDAKGTTSECDLEITIFLCSNGRFYVDEFDSDFKDIQDYFSIIFLSPEKFFLIWWKNLQKAKKGDRNRCKKFSWQKE